MQFIVPKWILVLITTLQIAQMIWGCFITMTAYNYVRSGEHVVHSSQRYNRYIYTYILQLLHPFR
ncbi:unnamed protein product, partial [Heterotrigona itama]